MSITGPGDIGSPFRSLLRICLYAAFTAAVLPVQSVAILLHAPLRETLPLWYHRQCCRILGIRIERRGRKSRMRPTLYVSNHASYIDISILGSLIRGCFVAKSEVATWPLFGLLAKLQRTVFVERRPSRAAEQRDAISRRLAAGDDLILFPEGTSSDGNRVLPFKSALLSVAQARPQGEALTVQPVTISYSKLDGLPLGRGLRPLYAWYGDMDMASHIWHLAGVGTLTVVVHFHPPVTGDQFNSRKDLSRHCEAVVAQGMSRALAGRPQQDRRAPAAPAAVRAAG